MPSFENVGRWMDKIEIDYFTQFIKAWIPFNAWYKKSYLRLEGDRAIIQEIKRGNNTFYNAIKTYIEAMNPDSQNFKIYFGNLHNSLENNTIENEGKRITFTGIVIERNQANIDDIQYDGIHYHSERQDNGRINIAVTSSTQTLFHITINDYDFTKIESSRDYSRLTDNRKRYLKSRFDLINPDLPVNLLYSTPSNFIQIGSYKFINDSIKLSKGLIEVLYLLRCVLFHGEIVPNDSISEVYKAAYEILYLVLKKIR